VRETERDREREEKGKRTREGGRQGGVCVWGGGVRSGGYREKETEVEERGGVGGERVRESTRKRETERERERERGRERERENEGGCFELDLVLCICILTRCIAGTKNVTVV